jgi:hypothetical protein
LGTCLGFTLNFLLPKEVTLGKVTNFFFLKKNYFMDVFIHFVCCKK